MNYMLDSFLILDDHPRPILPVTSATRHLTVMPLKTLSQSALARSSLIQHSSIKSTTSSSSLVSGILPLRPYLLDSPQSPSQRYLASSSPSSNNNIKPNQSLTPAELERKRKEELEEKLARKRAAAALDNSNTLIQILSNPNGAEYKRLQNDSTLPLNQERQSFDRSYQRLSTWL